MSQSPPSSRRTAATTSLLQRLSWLPVILISLVPSLAPAQTREQAQTRAKRPNVLMIAVDDLNHWVGHLGRNTQAKTPNIDRLASRGVTFTRAYCAVPACEPSRAALMGGRRPWTSGCYKNGDEWKEYQRAGDGLSAQFLKSGYRVSGAGKIYHSMEHFPSEWSNYMPTQGLTLNGPGVSKMDGFHDPMNHDLKDDDLLDWHAVDYCIDQIENAGEEPFFIACGLYKPHLPFAAPRKYFDQFPVDEIALPPYREDDLSDIPPAGRSMAKSNGDHKKFVKSGRWKHAIRSYLATCSYTDMNLGRLLDALDASAAKDNTIILLWGDHGWSFGEKDHWRKFALWEEPTRVPFIWVVPGMTEAGTRCERTVDLMSVYPTLCDLAGIAVPSHVEGRSIANLLESPGSRWQTPAITTHGYQNHTVRSEKWRYIRYANGGEELYDENADPYEWTNLADQEAYRETIAELAHWLPTDEKPPRKKQK